MVARKHSSNAKEKGIKVKGEGKYCLVPRQAIQIVSRPDSDNSNKIFFNPREASSFSPEKLASLIFSIRQIGLIEPPCVNAITNKKDEIVKIELIAGERRKRSIDIIVENNLSCFDEDLVKPKVFAKNQVVLHKGEFCVVQSQNKDVLQLKSENNKEVIAKYVDILPTILGKDLYDHIPCKLIYNCSEKTALGIAIAENEQSEPISISAEIEWVERLVRQGWKLEEIAEINNNNITWVSQTASFRTQLPAEVFDKLYSGKMARNVAVTFLSYPAETRRSLALETIKIEEQKTSEEIDKHHSEQVKFEENVEFHLDEANRAEKFGDIETAEKERNKARINKEKAKKSNERKQKAIADKGVITTGHVKQAAAKIHIAPRKGKTLDSTEIEEYYLKTLMCYVTGDTVDPVTKNIVPGELAAIARRIAMAIRNGNRDSLGVIRDYMVENQKWTTPDEKTLQEQEEAILLGLPDDDE